MRRQTDQQTITIISLDYHRMPGSLLQHIVLIVCMHARAIDFFLTLQTERIA